MRFNPKHTVLHFLEQGTISEPYKVINKKMHPGQVEQFKSDIDVCFKHFAPFFKGRVQYITQPFYDAYLAAKEKLVDVMKTESLGDASGTFVLNVGQGITKTIFYAIKHHKAEDNGSLRFIYMEFSKSRDTGLLILEAGALQNDAGMSFYLSDTYIRNSVDSFMIVAEFILMCLFIKYCEVETKVLKPNEKYRDKKKTKYFNETKSSIEILDSTWFTNLVVEGTFPVTGHWKLQPYGPALSQRKLIFIDPYERHGYTRRARKEAK
jgi:hypothetical protein